MLRRKKALEDTYIDDAKSRLMMASLVDKLKDIGLFIIVAAVLTWLVLGVL